MASSDRAEWHAAITLWNELSLHQQDHAIGYIASGDAALVAEASRAAMNRTGTPRAVTAAATTVQANTAVAHLDTRQMRDVLYVLALHVPAAVLDAIAEAGQ